MTNHDTEFEVDTDDVRVSELDAATWVLITEDRIRLEGWKRTDENDPCERHHCDDRSDHGCICGDLADPYLEAVARWHNDTHPGTFGFCDHSPCAELREVARTV